MQFSYNASSSNVYLDSNWCKANENGIQLFYRKDARYEWQAANDSLAIGSNALDKNGNIYAKDIIAGDYALAIERPGYIDPVQTDAPGGPCVLADNIIDENINKTEDLFSIYPNPTNKKINIACHKLFIEDIDMKVIDSNGKLIFENEIEAFQSIKTIDQNWQMGTFTILFYQNHNLIQSSQIIIQ
jgi:hypothetical protein